MKKTLILAAVLLVGCAVGASAQMIENFDSYTAPGSNGDVLFHQPSFSGSTAGQLDANGPNDSVVVSDQAASGPNSLKVAFKWTDTGSWLRLTTYNVSSTPNPAIDYSLGLEFKILYTSGDPLGIAIGSRDNGTTAAIGQNGGASGEIEWIGATGGTSAAGPTCVNTISAAPGWQTITIWIPSQPVAGFTGNGKLDKARGTVEHLAFVRTGSAGPYEFYLDDVKMVPEPGSLLALASGLAGFAGLARRRRA